MPKEDEGDDGDGLRPRVRRAPPGGVLREAVFESKTIQHMCGCLVGMGRPIPAAVLMQCLETPDMKFFDCTGSSLGFLILGACLGSSFGYASTLCSLGCPWDCI